MANRPLAFACTVFATAIAACTASQATKFDDAGLASGRYRTQSNSEAIVSVDWSVPTISFMAGGDPSVGVAVGADCEMVARYSRDDGKWRLAPFTTERTTVRQRDLKNLQFEIVRISDRAFDVRTDYDVTLCAQGVRISGRYAK